MTSTPLADRRRRGFSSRRRTGSPDAQLSLVDHLRELRRRLAVSLVVVAVGVVIAYWQWRHVYAFLSHPYCQIRQAEDLDCQLFTFGPLDQFLVRMRVSLIAGCVGTAPVWFYQLGAFITPGLHRQERRWAAGFVGASLALFAIGATFAYLSVSKGLGFLLGVGGDGITPLLDVSRYLSFVTLMLLAFGVSFEFPVVVIFLNLVGVLSAARMQALRRAVIFGIFVLAAVITPSQDPFTFLAMAVPLTLMYEVCILIARGRDRARRRRELSAGYGEVDDDEPSPLDAEPSAFDSRPSQLT